MTINWCHLLQLKPTLDALVPFSVQWDCVNDMRPVHYTMSIYECCMRWWRSRNYFLTILKYFYQFYRCLYRTHTSIYCNDLRSFVWTSMYIFIHVWFQFWVIIRLCFFDTITFTWKRWSNNDVLTPLIHHGFSQMSTVGRVSIHTSIYWNALCPSVSMYRCINE